jgi:hypothetical protein
MGAPSIKQLRGILREGKTMNLWDEEYTPWKSKAQFLNWIRGGLRRLWSRHPAKTELKNRHRKKLPNEKGREVWHNQCAVCEEWKRSLLIEINVLPAK